MATIRLLLILFPIAGCTPSKEAPCSAAYDHLVTIAKQEEHPGIRERFIMNCVNAWDDERIKCLMASQNPKEATECRAGRVPPG